MPETANKIRVGILRGGTGNEYKKSIEHGGELLQFIEEHLNQTYKTVDILVDRDGILHTGGLPILLSDLVHKVDVVWNTSHPSFANALGAFAVPTVGQDAFLFGLNNDYGLLRDHARKAEVQIPRSVVLPVYQEDLDGSRAEYSIIKAKEVHSKFGAPWIVRSYNPDKDMGIHVAKTFGDLVSAIDDGVNHGDSILVQEFITGKEASVHSVPDFRNEQMYAFPVVHEKDSLLKFSKEEKEKLLKAARSLHSVLGAKHYLKSNLIITPSGRVYLASVEAHPDLKEGSHLHKACETVGAKMHHIVEHILASMLK